MVGFHFDHRDTQPVFCDAVERFVSTVQALSDYELLAASRCHGWAVMDVVTHVRVGLQEMLGAFTAFTEEPADQDAMTYWQDYAGDSDPVDPILWTRRTAAAYRRPSGAVPHLRMAADAVDSASARMRDGRVSFQGHTLSTGDFLATWTVELAVHQLDLGHTIDVAEPTPGSARLARRTVEALLGTELPTALSDISCALLGTGRRVPSRVELELLGPAGERLPVLG